MLSDYFVDTICKESTIEERVTAKKIFEDALQGHLCTVMQEGSLSEDLIADDPEEIFPSKLFCRFGKYHYLQKNWVLETRVLKELKRLLRPIEAIAPSHLEGLNPQQQAAVKLALHNRLSIITGGPGTGKTFTAERIVRSFLTACPDARVVLAAPTGKAASRLEACLAGKAATLHSLLKDSDEGLELEADLILVDECSMVDVALFARLFAAIPEGARLILVGDGDQLPPVEAGSLFADLAQCNSIPCVSLISSLRSKQQEILHLAASIKAGDVEACMQYIQPIDVWKEVDAHFPGPFDHEPDVEVVLPLFERFRFLSCLRKGPLGVDKLNQAIFRYFLTSLRPGQWLATPILITKNDQETGLYNGDSGILVQQPSSKTSYALFAGKKLSMQVLPPFEYAYVLSVHKSQGSEYEKIAVLVPTGSEVFGREVLYTAITRAKNAVQIDGDALVIRAALQHSARRCSGVRERIGKFIC